MLKTGSFLYLFFIVSQNMNENFERRQRTIHRIPWDKSVKKEKRLHESWAKKREGLKEIKVFYDKIIAYFTLIVLSMVNIPL